MKLNQLGILERSAQFIKNYVFYWFSFSMDLKMTLIAVFTVTPPVTVRKGEHWSPQNLNPLLHEFYYFSSIFELYLINLDKTWLHI